MSDDDAESLKECQGWIIKIVFLLRFKIHVLCGSKTHSGSTRSIWLKVHFSFHFSLSVSLSFSLSLFLPIPQARTSTHSSVWQKQKNEESMEKRIRRVQKIEWRKYRKLHELGMHMGRNGLSLKNVLITILQPITSFIAPGPTSSFHHLSLCFKHCRAISRIFKKSFLLCFWLRFFDIRAIPSFRGCWKLAFLLLALFFFPLFLKVLLGYRVLNTHTHTHTHTHTKSEAQIYYLILITYFYFFVIISQLH